MQATHRPPVPFVDAPVGACPGDDAQTLDFRAVFAAQAKFVWRALLGLGVGDADVQDASQQVFIVLHQKLSRYDGTSSLRTFVYGICLRVASEFRRSARRRREDGLDQAPERTSAPPQLAQVATREALDHLQLALDRLPNPQRDVFVLYEIEELTMPEVAEAVGCPLFTAYSRLRAARSAIAGAFGEAWIAYRDDADSGGTR